MKLGERTVRRFHDRTTETDFHVTTDDTAGELFRVVGVHHSSEHGEHGAFITPEGARVLARALTTAADRADKEQVQKTRSTVRRELKRSLSKMTPAQLSAIAGPAVPAAPKPYGGLSPERIRRAREAGGRLTSELETALAPPPARRRKRRRTR